MPHLARFDCVQSAKPQALYTCMGDFLTETQSAVALLCSSIFVFFSLVEQSLACLQGRTDEQRDVSSPVGTSEDWAILDSGKSFTWSAQQQGTLQQQFEALDKLIQQQGQQVSIWCL